MAWYRRARKGLHRVPFCLHCCPTSTCITCWTLWFSRRVSRQHRGEAYYSLRFADDYVACFQYRDDAESFQRGLKNRLEGFGLELAEEKTRCIEFGRFARRDAYRRGEKPKEFTFLGFTHYCGKTKEGYFKVKRRTSRKKLGQSLEKFTDWAKESQTGTEERRDA